MNRQFAICSLLLLAVVSTAVVAQTTCPGPCGAEWYIKISGTKGGDISATFVTEESASETPSEQTARWKNPASRANHALRVECDDPGPNLDNELSSLNKTAEGKVRHEIAWDEGDSLMLECKHGRPDGHGTEDKGKCEWSGSGSGTVKCGGNANNFNPALNYMGVSEGSASTTLQFSGLEGKTETIAIGGAKVEGENGLITWTPPGPPTGVLNITADNWVGVPKSATISVSGPNSNPPPGTISPPDIMGQHLTGKAVVAASCSIDSGAVSAYAEANSTMSCTVTANGGKHSSCCGMKGHSDHGMGDEHDDDSGK